MGNAAAKDGLRQVAAPRHAQPAVAAKGSLALLGHVHVVVRRIVDNAGDDLPFALQRDRDCEQRDRVQEVRRRIERIDVPGVALIGPLDAPAFLQDEAIARARLGKLLVEALFRALVGKTDKVARSLHRHLQFADFAKIAFEPAASLDRSAGHHGHQSRADHGCLSSAAGSRGRFMEGFASRQPPSPARAGSVDVRNEAPGAGSIGVVFGAEGLAKQPLLGRRCERARQGASDGDNNADAGAERQPPAEHESTKRPR